MIIRDYKTLVKFVLLKIELNTIKLLKIKQLQKQNYFENIKYLKRTHTEQIEERNK